MSYVDSSWLGLEAQPLATPGIVLRHFSRTTGYLQDGKRLCATVTGGVQDYRCAMFGSGDTEG